MLLFSFFLWFWMYWVPVVVLCYGIGGLGMFVYLYMILPLLDWQDHHEKVRQWNNGNLSPEMEKMIADENLSR